MCARARTYLRFGESSVREVCKSFSTRSGLLSSDASNSSKDVTISVFLVSNTWHTDAKRCVVTLSLNRTKPGDTLLVTTGNELFHFEAAQDCTRRDPCRRDGPRYSSLSNLTAFVSPNLSNQFILEFSKLSNYPTFDSSGDVELSFIFVVI